MPGRVNVDVMRRFAENNAISHIDGIRNHDSGWGDTGPRCGGQGLPHPHAKALPLELEKPTDA